MTKILHNSPLFLHLDADMQDRAGQMFGQRNSNYLYRLDAESNGYQCNIFFSPQPQMLLSRILAAKPDDLKNSKIDLTFVTDFTAQEFDDLTFRISAQDVKFLRNYLFSITKPVNFNHNWEYTIDVNKLCNLLSKNPDNDDLLRQIDTIVHSTRDLKSIVVAVINSLGKTKAKAIIPRAYKMSNLATLWFDSLRSLKNELDKRHLSHENMNTMQFSNQQNKLQRFTK